MAQCRHTDVRTLYRKLAGDLDWITLKAIEKDRARRYVTVDAFVLDIRRYLHHEPVSVAPPGVVYKSRKFLRRHRTAVAATMAAMLAIAGISLGLAMYGRARQAELRAESINHNRVLSETRVLFDNRQYEPAKQMLETIMHSRHVNRAAQLLHAKAVRELQGPVAAVEELEGLLGPVDEIAGEAHFLLAKTYDEATPTDAKKAKEYSQKREYHRSEAERLVPAIARYYFLRRRVSLANQEGLDLLRRSLQLAPSKIFGTPVNAGPAVNSPHSEITPSIFADGLTLCFTSDRPGGQGDYDIWMATRASLEDAWSEPVNLGPPVNTSDFEGFQSLSSDGLELYFSRGNTDHGDIYVAVRNSPEDQWQTPVRLPANINSETGQDWGAVPSFDGLTLCWISTRPGGPGGMDIWFVHRPAPQGDWSGCPEPLPPPVNSPALEGRKCTSADERILFFQRPDVGESLYVVIRESKTDPWSSPVDLGPVLAGSKMPYITSLSADGAELYFCDHPWTEPRPGGQGREDIWYLPLTASPRAATAVETASNTLTQP